MEKEQLIELVKKSQAGDPAAIEALLENAYTSVSYQCRKLLKNAQDAEDVTQEVLLTLYKKLDTLQEPAAFWGWLNRITANRCMNALSRTHLDLSFLEDEDGHSVMDDVENEDEQLVPEAALDNAETARMIGEIVDELPPAQKMCTLLFYYDEMSVREISEITGASENTVKSRLNYARKAIKTRVLDYEKQGIKLYQISPISLLLYFLRKEAAESADPVMAQKAAHRILKTGNAVQKDAPSKASARAADSAAGAAGSAADSAAGAAGSAADSAAGAAGAASGAAGSAVGAAGAAAGAVSIKVAAAILAGLVTIGGAGVGMAALSRHVATQQLPVELTLPDEEDSLVETDALAASSETETDAKEASLSDFDLDLLAQLPYTGDLEKCAMTTKQAEAFCKELDAALQESKSLAPGGNYSSFCRAALFDAGSGIPALWITEGYGYETDGSFVGESSYFKIFYWDGTRAVLAIDSSRSQNIANCNLTDQGLLVGCKGNDIPNSNSLGWFFTEYSELYEFSNGMITRTPAHVLERFTLSPNLVHSLSDAEKDEMRELIMQYGTTHGKPYVSYDYETLTADKWTANDPTGYDPGITVVAIDGTFYSPSEVFLEDPNYIFWWYAGEDCVLGQGEHNYTGASRFYWNGNWDDAEDLLEKLSDAAQGTDSPSSASANVTTDPFQKAPEDSDAEKKDSIVRTILNRPEMNIDVYSEIPHFQQDDGAGYAKINAYFESLQREWMDPQGDILSMILEDGASDFQSEPYTMHYIAEIKEQTDRYVSISIEYYTYLRSRPYSEITLYNFRMDTGELLYLSDLFDASEQEIKAEIQKSLLAHPDLNHDITLSSDNGAQIKIDDWLSEWISQKDVDDFSFYIQDGHVILYFAWPDDYQMRGWIFELELPLKAKLP